MDIPLVSILIPVYNGENFVLETLESAHNQEYQRTEIIIVDDCSQDKSLDIINNWASGKSNILVHKNHTNIGIVKCCNFLLNKATGKYFQLLGHDDLICPFKIDRQVKLFEHGGEKLGLVFSDVSVIDGFSETLFPSYLEEQGIAIDETYLENKTLHLLRVNFIPAPSVLLKTSVVKNLGGFDEELRFEDLDLWLRISLEFDFLFLNQVTAHYRRTHNSMIHSPDNSVNLSDSLLKCREKYRNLNQSWDSEINNGLERLAPSIFRSGHPNGSLWIRKWFSVKLSLRSLYYYMFMILRITKKML